jgi:hypothetical protein
MLGRYRHFLEDTRWDVVVIDEAHNVAAAANPEKQLNYRLARLLSRRTDSLLLTTATPHNGRRETFGRLITLLDWSAIPDPKLREYGPDDIAPFFLMRFKEDVRAEAGDQFAERQMAPLAATTMEATVDEEASYAELGNGFRRTRQGRAVQDRSDHPVGALQALSVEPRSLPVDGNQANRHAQQDPDREDEAAALANPEKPAFKSRSPRAAVSSCWFGNSKPWAGPASPQSPRVLLFTESTVTQIALAHALAQEFNIAFSERHEDQSTQVDGHHSRRPARRHALKDRRSFRHRLQPDAFAGCHRRGLRRREPASRVPQHHPLRPAVVDHHPDPAQRAGSIVSASAIVRSFAT